MSIISESAIINVFFQISFVLPFDDASSKERERERERERHMIDKLSIIRTEFETWKENFEDRIHPMRIQIFTNGC